MATIRKKGDLQWHVQVRKKGFPTATKTFETRAEAEAWAAVIESEMVRGVFVDRSEAEATTLYSALDRYKREISAEKKSAKAEGYRIEQLKAHALALRSLASLTSSDFAKYRDERLKAVSPATTRLDLALLSNLFTVASKEWNLGIANPVAGIRLPKLKNARDRRLEGDEETRLMVELEKSRNIYLKPLVQLALETGARMGELRALEWRHINFEKSQAKLFDTKNGEDRIIPLSARAKAILSDLKSAKVQSINPLIFPTSKDAISHSFASACARAEIEDLKFHDLRHEAVSRLFEKDLNMMEVASVSGHKTLSMLKRYTHLNAERIAAKLSAT